MNAVNADLKSLGDTVRFLRTTKKMSAETLAQKIGATETVIRRIESGSHKVTLLEITAVAGALGTSAEELLASAKI